MVATSISPLTDTSFLNSVLPVICAVLPTASVPPTEALVATSRSPLTDTSPSKTALPTTVTVEPNWVAPVAVSVPQFIFQYSRPPSTMRTSDSSSK